MAKCSKLVSFWPPCALTSKLVPSRSAQHVDKWRQNQSPAWSEPLSRSVELSRLPDSKSSRERNTRMCFPQRLVHSPSKYNLVLQTPRETRWIVVRTISATSRGGVPLVLHPSSIHAPTLLQTSVHKSASSCPACYPKKSGKTHAT